MPAVQGSRHYQTFRDLTQAALKYSLPHLDLPHEPKPIETLMSGYAPLEAPVFYLCRRTLGIFQAPPGRGLPPAK
jgi:hypothetical protein